MIFVQNWKLHIRRDEEKRKVGRHKNLCLWLAVYFFVCFLEVGK